MVLRPAIDTIVALRRTLLHLENAFDPHLDADSIAELKRIVLLRIAELEAEVALEAQTTAVRACTPALPDDLAAEEPAA